MKGFLKKFTVFLFAVFCCFVGGFGLFSENGKRSFAVAVAETDTGRFPKGVKVDEISVGGMKKKDAFALLRREDALRPPYLKVTTPKGETRFYAPEIGFLDDLEEIYTSAQKRGNYTRSVRWFLKGEEEKIERILADNGVQTLSATVFFSKDGFSYSPHRTGLVCEREKLQKDIEKALCSPIEKDEKGERRFACVRLSVKEKTPNLTLENAKKRTEKLSSFTTYYDTQDRGRCENIRLATDFLDGTTILAGQTFSFNSAVGERTKKRGFRDAKIIQSGEFIYGAGGGVCQVSTTLYNAALKAGMKILERRPHSLCVSYVDPSRDAMVSSCSDLRFQNPFSEPVYLSAKTGSGYVQITFYGKNRGERYEIVSVVLEEILPPEPLVKESEKDGEIKKGRSGLKSEAYLERYAGGRLIERKRLGVDVYAPVRGVVGKKNENASKKMP
ncbi:MAG: VanW family protein [Clostridia bacterium]|nr:VanW family protein [Clostridia bacterium]